MRFVGVIPARYHSTRLAGKPLLNVAGKPLIQHVYENALRCRRLDDLIVATDHPRVFEAVKTFGGKAELTSSDLRSGTDRVAEVASRRKADVFVNIQGDEPCITPATIENVCTPFEGGDQVEIATARVRIQSLAEAQDPNVVKVVVDRAGNALYFSRSLIPYAGGEEAAYYKHLGIYAYRRQFLLQLAAMAESRLEKWERLEQLRFLENGFRIRVVEVMEDSIGVDTVEDLERVRLLLENTGKC
ncbi:MAG: 3-deoxy-manno-octulosonate cytidylyltransferase [Acidobacteria bacterium]|nr:3-deoxy-manno-octulosonate cytidylyltransferase [Acidobacteriota bacterium]